MRAELPKREPSLLEQWNREDIYGKLMADSSRPDFHLHDGPPFANGDAHMGHALNMTLKDIVLKSRGILGYRTPFVPGWDCHGLPIEHKVVKELGASTTDPVEIRRKCAEYARKYIAVQKEQFRRLGVFGEWENPYLTLDPAYEADILRVFAGLVEKGLVYQSLRPVYWSTGCQTALAEAEVEYQDRTDISVWVRMKLQAPEWQGASLVIWTTTPWTLPANLAVAAHAQLEYALVESNGERLICAKSRVGDLSRFLGGEPAVLESFPGSRLQGAVYAHPFLEREGAVLLADFVTADSGTGLVHIAPGHGADDYQAGMKAGLAILSPVDDAGNLTAEAGVPALVGKNVFAANPLVVEILTGKGVLVGREDYQHSYPHCWRSKTPIVFRSVKQWFIRVDAFRADALREIDSVDWVPAWGRNRIRGAVESRPDWCISRQRNWGVPIPVFYGEGGQPMLSAELVSKFADLVEKQGTDLWFQSSDEEMAELMGLPKGVRKGKDTLDVWIDSGTSWASVTRKRLRFPADLYLEGSDQHRGWFQSSLLTCVAITGQAPYKQVLTNGFVVDLDGKKLSKSNTGYQKPIDLMSLVNKYGADILRLWVASQDFRDDVPFSEEIFTRVADTYRNIRNTLRVLLGNIKDYRPEQAASAEPTAVDLYVRARLKALARECSAAYTSYEFHLVYHALNRFCTVELSSFYVDVTKDRMYCDAAASPRRLAAQETMAEVIRVLCQLLAPMAPFTADEAWRALGHAESVHLSRLSVSDAAAGEPELFAAWDALFTLRDQANLQLEPLKKNKEIGKNLEAVVQVGREALAAWLESVAPRDAVAELAEIFNVGQMELVEGSGVSAKKAEGIKCPRCWRVLPPSPQHADHPDLCPRCTEAVLALPSS